MPAAKRKKPLRATRKKSTRLHDLALKEERRLKFLQAAMVLFLKEGFASVSMRKIASKVRISVGTIYLYYKGKDEILAALHNEGFNRLYALQQQLGNLQDPFDRLRAHTQLYIRFALENPEYYELMFIMKDSIRNLKTKEQWDIALRSYQVHEGIVAECTGPLPHEQVQTLAYSLWSFVHGLVSLHLCGRTFMYDPARMPAMLEASAGLLESFAASMGLKRKPARVRAAR